MEKTQENRLIYVLKDSNENYVSKNSIFYHEDAKMVVYSSSKFLTNGFYYGSDLSDIEADLIILELLNHQYDLDKKFRIEEIDMIKAIHEESKLDIPRHSFEWEYFEVKKVS